MNEKELAKIVESVVQTVGQQERGRSVYADVTLDMAKQLIAAVEQRAAQMGVNAVIAVANRGANPVAVHCMDNSSSLVVGGPVNVAVALANPTMESSNIMMKHPDNWSNNMIAINELIDVVKDSGVCGAGGAGFPSYGKIDARAKTIILNCAECEPLLRLHRQVLEKYPYEILSTLYQMALSIGCEQIIIGVKEAYKQTVEAVRAHLRSFPNHIHWPPAGGISGGR